MNELYLMFHIFVVLDMSAFKAANPDAVFEDFIRWHSPGDWENDDTEGCAGDGNNWPPRGKLSQRMSEHGNLWRQIWNDSPPLPVLEQKPLLDPIREGEKVLILSNFYILVLHILYVLIHHSYIVLILLG